VVEASAVVVAIVTAAAVVVEVSGIPASAVETLRSIVCKLPPIKIPLASVIAKTITNEPFGMCSWYHFFFR
jgi:hypothetical protein